MKKVENPLVSVIVPIYKVEAYLEQCIESIVSQSYTNLEILLLDDGSPDGCPAICDAWAEKDPRVRVVHKANSGVSDTRNLGISMAAGDYLLMPDGDDYLEPEAIAVLVGFAGKYGAQCVLGGYRRLHPDGTLSEHRGTDTVTVCRGKPEVQERILRRLIGAEYRAVKPLSQSACVKLYDRKLLVENGVAFLPIREIGSEDLYFNLCFFNHVQTAVIIPDTLYVYRDNGASCSNTYQPERLDSFLKLYRKLRETPLLPDAQEYQQMLAANILGGVSVCVKLLIASGSADTFRTLTHILEKEDIRRMLGQCRLSQIRFPLSLFCFLMKHRLKGTLYCLIKLFLKLN
ncbi:MAG: glycosyltransferase family 2 protein [Firmicutes bacterium]|nr:glycosyltransferase family 2 protein [Bacillota bacterium]